MYTLFDNTQDLDAGGPRAGLRAEIGDKSVRVSCRSLMHGEGWSLTFPRRVFAGITPDNAETMVTALFRDIELGEEVEFLRYSGKPPFAWARRPGSRRKFLV